MQLDGDTVIADVAGGLGQYRFACRDQGEWVFTDNETNTERLYQQPNRRPFQKDGFHRYICEGDQAAINPLRKGTKVARLLQKTLQPGEEWQLELRLVGPETNSQLEWFGEGFEVENIPHEFELDRRALYLNGDGVVGFGGGEGSGP